MCVRVRLPATTNDCLPKEYHWPADFFVIRSLLQSVPDRLKLCSLSDTLFKNSENGWINKELYLEWFSFFLENIPPTRPVLLVQDGHGSHVSIELIEMASVNDVHLLCFPSHTTYILQPLDVSVFKSFKTHFAKVCHKYIAKHPGQVITTDMIASLVAEAYLQPFTPLNILSGFKKCGIFSLNPGAVAVIPIYIS